MPDIELLMQEWPDDVEDLLRNIELPSADLDVPLSVYVSIVCGGSPPLCDLASCSISIACALCLHFLPPTVADPLTV